MLAGFDNNECAAQFSLGVAPKHPSQFLVRAVQSGRTGAQQDNAFPEMPQEYQPAKILVTRNEDSALLAGATQQDGIRSPGHSNFGGGDYIVAQATQVTRAQRVNVLVRQEFHATALT